MAVQFGNVLRPEDTRPMKGLIMREWIIAGWIHLVIGFALGWLVFKRPQWATDLIAKAKAKIGLG